ncbi:hypothetical protein JZ751_000353 [Albula glossodonta]|uniref:KIND domain-containing protein n=1 Tax=Albula glossodonta TaxID=121402 RepID=A0A8T2PW02_9TELE|nr:hypothetical protein JZ751_000353 [Albula glossodonta]
MLDLDTQSREQVVYSVCFHGPECSLKEETEVLLADLEQCLVVCMISKDVQHLVPFGSAGMLSNGPKTCAQACLPNGLNSLHDRLQSDFAGGSLLLACQTWLPWRLARWSLERKEMENSDWWCHSGWVATVYRDCLSEELEGRMPWRVTPQYLQVLHCCLCARMTKEWLLDSDETSELPPQVLCLCRNMLSMPQSHTSGRRSSEGTTICLQIWPLLSLLSTACSVTEITCHLPVHHHFSHSPLNPFSVIESLGIMIYKALDYGLKENEERELSPPLEQLIDLMTNMGDAERDTCPDEGYEATEEEDEGDDDPDGVCNAHGYRDILKVSLSVPAMISLVLQSDLSQCQFAVSGLAPGAPGGCINASSPCSHGSKWNRGLSSDAPSHYQAVCRALYAETKELHTFLEKIKSAKENLRKMEGETPEEPTRDLNELQNADWARFWVQVMRDLRHGVKLKTVQARQYDPLPIEYQLTPYEMLMDDIRCKRYKLRKVMVNGDIPPRLKKSAHEVILEFIRSRPPLNPGSLSRVDVVEGSLLSVSARKLKPHPPRPRSLHERILEEIKAERKLRPVSPEEIRRMEASASVTVMPSDRWLSQLESSESYSCLIKLAAVSHQRRPPAVTWSQTPVRRDGDQCHLTSDIAARSPPVNLVDPSGTGVCGSPIMPFTRGSSSVACVYTPDAPKKRPVSTLALANGMASAQGQRTAVDGAQALSQRKRLLKAPTLAELNSSDSDEESTCISASSSSMSTSLMDDTSPESVVGKKTPPMFLPISSTPQPEKRHVYQRRHSIEKETPTNVRQFVPPSRQSSKSLVLCQRRVTCIRVGLVTGMFLQEEFCYPVECLALTVEEVMHIRQVLVKAELEKFQQYKDVYNALKKGKMRLPSKPFANLPIYSLGSGALLRGEVLPPPDKASCSPQHQALQRSGSRVAKQGESSSRGDGDLPWELTEGWSTMEVCVDCKKFISEIISSSKRSLANKRARLMRKTQSFRVSTPKSADYRPSEHTIKEVCGAETFFCYCLGFESALVMSQGPVGMLGSSGHVQLAIGNFGLIQLQAQLLAAHQQDNE